MTHLWGFHNLADSNGPAAAQLGGGDPSTAQPAQMTSGQGGGGSGFQVPDGYDLVPKTEREASRRYEQQVRGFQPLYERLSKAGIKSEKDWDGYEPLISTAKARKIDAKQFAAMFSDEAEQDLKGTGKGGGSGAGAGGGFDIEDLRKQAREEARGEFYNLSHEQASKGNEKVIAAAVDKFLGTPATGQAHTEYDKAVARGAVKAWMEDPVNRPLYPEGHPLRDKAFAPFDETTADSCLKHFSDLRAQQKGKDMTAAARAATAGAKGGAGAGRVATVAGGGGSPSGKPNTKNTAGRSGGRPSIEEVESAFAARKAARGE